MAEPYIEPKLPWVFYGDGSVGVIVRSIRETDANGTPVITMTVSPTDTMKLHWKIKDSDLVRVDKWLCFTQSYPEDYVFTLSQDPSMPAIMVECDYKNGDTPATNRRANLITQLKTLRQINNSLKGQLAYTLQTMRKATSEQEEFEDEQVRRLKKLGSIVKKPSDEELYAAGSRLA